MQRHYCKECSYFRQHYILDEQCCTAINCGHCVHPRVKSRSPHTAACPHFAQRENNPPLPADKHFLTLEILRWAQSLEFPPEVHTDLPGE